jgi:hypothetical protein
MCIVFLKMKNKKQLIINLLRILDQFIKKNLKYIEMKIKSMIILNINSIPHK